jgi:hypothetical protein
VNYHVSTPRSSCQALSIDRFSDALARAHVFRKLLKKQSEAANLPREPLFFLDSSVEQGIANERSFITYFSRRIEDPASSKIFAAIQ